MSIVLSSDKVRAKKSKSGMDVVVSEGGGRSEFFLYLLILINFLSILGRGGGREKRQQLQGG